VESKGSFQRFVQRLRSGDSQAATDLYNRYVHQLIQLAARRISLKYRAKYDPDDVVQSVFYSFFRRDAEDQFDVDDWDNLWSLLATITIRKCGRRAKAYTRDRRNVDRESPEPEAWNIDCLHGGEPSVEDAMVLEETLQQLLSDLTPEQSKILKLRLQNYSVEEISERVHRTERTVYRVLSLIREQLEALALGDECS
jgi:RNA polymerase sigma-70 factor (ECF subfamily)